MLDVFTVVLPVFIVLAFGYTAVWSKIIEDAHIDGLMKFAQTFAIPWFAVPRDLDARSAKLSEPAIAEQFLRRRRAGIHCGPSGRALPFRAPLGRLRRDLVLLPVFKHAAARSTHHRAAYGPEGLIGNYAIITFHAPFGYMLGITAMELVRAQGTPMTHLPLKVGKAMFSNAIVLGIGLGFAVNLTGLPLPNVFTDALDIIGRAALPAALFGLGGVLYRYRPEGDMRVIVFICLVSMGLHPLVVYILGTSGNIGTDALRSGLITAAVAPGANAYIFANMYGAARRVAASAVLFGTALSILTTSLWITLLP